MAADFRRRAHALELEFDGDSSSHAVPIRVGVTNALREREQRPAILSAPDRRAPLHAPDSRANRHAPPTATSRRRPVGRHRDEAPAALTRIAPEYRSKPDAEHQGIVRANAGDVQWDRSVKCSVRRVTPRGSARRRPRKPGADDRNSRCNVSAAARAAPRANHRRPRSVAGGRAGLLRISCGMRPPESRGLRRCNTLRPVAGRESG
jgi:hypothetical protein